MSFCFSPLGTTIIYGTNATENQNRTLKGGKIRENWFWTPEIKKKT